jgi:hypothetical protein
MIRQINVQTGVETQREMTTEERASSDTITAQELADKPMREWKEKIAETDAGMPRYLEDHITDDHDGVAGNEFLQAKYDGKKALRLEKP